MFRAKDIMSKRVMSVKEDAKVQDVIRLLVEHEITGVPVVSEDMRLLGIVTEKDVLETLLYDPEVKGKSVADLMTTEIISFAEDEDLMNVFRSLVESNFRRVPILSEGRLVGIISRRDIINFLSKRAGGGSARNKVEDQEEG